MRKDTALRLKSSGVGGAGGAFGGFGDHSGAGHCPGSDGIVAVVGGGFEISVGNEILGLSGESE